MIDTQQIEHGCVKIVDGHRVVNCRVAKVVSRAEGDSAFNAPACQHKGKAHVMVEELAVQWLDVGSWPALAETLNTDEHNNAAECKTCVFLDSDDNIIVCEDETHLVSLIGISDMIVVHTKDATLVCPKSESQRVKELVEKVKEKYGERYL